MLMLKSLLQEVRAARRRSGVKARQNGNKSLAAIERTGMTFIHIPKCGGKTVIQQLYGLEFHEYFGHADVEFYAALLGPKNFSRYVTFAVVRDPVERARSAFHFTKRGEFGDENGMRRQAALGEISWKEFLSSGRLHELSQTYTVFRPQVSFLRRKTGKINCDVLLRTERLSEDLEQLTRGRLCSEHIAVENRGSYDLRKQPSADELAAVAEVYPEDVDLFNGKIIPLISDAG